MGEIAVEYRVKLSHHDRSNSKGCINGNSQASHEDRTKSALNPPLSSMVNKVVCYSGRSTRPEDANTPLHSPVAMPHISYVPKSPASPQIHAAPITRKVYTRLQNQGSLNSSQASHVHNQPQGPVCVAVPSVVDFNRSACERKRYSAVGQIKYDQGRAQQITDTTLSKSSGHTTPTSHGDYELSRLVRRIVGPTPGEKNHFPSQIGSDYHREGVISHYIRSPHPESGANMAPSGSPAATGSNTSRIHLKHGISAAESTMSQYSTKSMLTPGQSPELADAQSSRLLRKADNGTNSKCYVSYPAVITPPEDISKTRRNSHSTSSIGQPSNLASKNLIPYKSDSAHHIDTKNKSCDSKSPELIESNSRKNMTSNIWESGHLTVDAVDIEFSNLAIHCLGIPKLSKTWLQDSMVKTEPGFDPFEGESPKMPSDIVLSLPQSYTSRLMALDCL